MQVYAIEPQNYELFKFYIRCNKEPPNLRNVSIETIQKLIDDVENLKKDIEDSFQKCYTYIKDTKNRQYNQKNRNPNFLKTDIESAPPKKTCRPQNTFPLIPSLNENGVWVKSEPFFQKLPSDDVLHKLFSPLDQIAKLEQEEMEYRNDPKSKNNPHWSERMKRFVRNKMQPLPLPQSESESILECWNGINLPFQIESAQKQQSNPFHCLLNAFVEIGDPNISELTQSDKKEVPLITFSLLPQVESESYLALSFDQRLQLELQSLGLDRPDETTLPFQSEIDSYFKENKEILPQLTKFQQMFLSNVGQYREDQQQRFDKYDKSRKKLNTMEMPTQTS